MYHDLEQEGSIHQSHNWQYATAVLREAAALTANDIGKVARQTDNNSYWVVSGGGWLPFTGTFTVTAAEASTIQTNQTAIPGASYLETESDTLYFGTTAGDLLSCAGFSPPVEQASPWVDFRFVDMGTLTLEVTSTATITQDKSRGLYCEVPAISWNRGVKFMDDVHTRASGSVTSMVFQVAANTKQGMMGVIDSTANINALAGVYAAEVMAWLGTTSISRCYGQNSVGTGAYKFFTAVPTLAGKFYRLDFEIGPALGIVTFTISEVDPLDWDSTTVLYTISSWGLTIGGMATSLVPFWLTYDTSLDAYYLAGYKVV